MRWLRGNCPSRIGPSPVCLLVVCLLVAADAHGQPPQGITPRNTGPAAVAHSHTHYRRRKTVRVIRRTPEVMREDARRVSRGELFRTWSNDYLR
jgi:hypothetical protein